MTSERRESRRDSERARQSAGEIAIRRRDQPSKPGETGYARCAATDGLDNLCVYVARSSLILLDDVVRLTRYRCFGLLFARDRRSEKLSAGSHQPSARCPDR